MYGTWKLNIDSDIENVDKDSQPPIFPGASISIGSFMLLLAMFCTKHNITGDRIQQLLNIITLVLPVQNILCKTLGWILSITARALSRNVASGTYEHIYDGKLYKSYVENDGPLNHPENISFTFNTDGASVFKSSNVSISLIYLIVSELPYRLRMKKENLFLGALRFGNQKLSMATSFKPFIDTMKVLSNGVQCFSSGKGEFLCKGFVLACTADLPARCLLCNSNQFNGASLYDF